MTPGILLLLSSACRPACEAPVPVPDALGWSDVLVGAPHLQEVLLSSTCDEPLDLAHEVEGDGCFSVLGVPDRLEPGATATVEVTFTPDDASPRSAALVLTTARGRSSSLDLTGQAAADWDGDGHPASLAGGDDCDDADPDTHPGADEYCNGHDDDCDGEVDEDDAVDVSEWYADSDNDGYGDPNAARAACEAPSGYVSDASDCDDTDPDVNPGAEEDDFDGVDTDCDGVLGCQEDPWLDMVRVPAGTFTMGSPGDEVGRDDDEDLHEVTLTGDFCLGVHEVTQDEYEGWTGETPSYFSACGGDCPVEEVSWHEAALLANLVSDAAGYARCYDCSGGECTPAGSPYDCEGYRLPTEAEWERAARGGLEGASFPSGGQLVEGTEESCDARLELTDGSELGDQAWFCGNSAGQTRQTHLVMMLEPNAYELYDMSGNVWEWCHDGYEDYGGDATNPTGPSSGSKRVGRGGSWSNAPRYARVAGRDWGTPSHRGDVLGTRLSRSAP